jgi:hypothetical protein
MKGQPGLSLYNMRFVENTAYTWYGNPRGQSTVDSLANSVVVEDDGTFNITSKSIGNTFVLNGLGKVNLPVGTPASNNSFTKPGVFAPF